MKYHRDPFVKKQGNLVTPLLEELNLERMGRYQGRYSIADISRSD